MKILVADDSATNRAVLSALLLQMGHQPLFAEDGREAVEVFERDLPDFILMDVMMPIEDGLSATRRIKALSETMERVTPVIMVTALDSDADLINGIEAGADDYFTKPIKMPVVRAKVSAMARAVELQRDLEQKKLDQVGALKLIHRLPPCRGYRYGPHHGCVGRGAATTVRRRSRRLQDERGYGTAADRRGRRPQSGRQTIASGS